MYTSLFTIFLFYTIVECKDMNFTKILDLPEDATLNIMQLVKKYGYDIQAHSVITEDGYHLTIHRIPYVNGTPVLLMHGLMESSDSWLLQGPNLSLAYVLADQGFDVWMGNARGNKHSTGHKTLNYTSTDYWKFTWEEIGLYDLPTIIDYILEKTGRKSLYYIGHSQGTTIGYVLLSMKPEYNKKINIMFSLAPEAFMANVQSPFIKLFSLTANYFTSFLLNISIYSPGTEMFNKMMPLLCRFWPWNCENVLYYISGFEHKINSSLVPVIFGHSPTGSSTLQFIHYVQLMNSKRFCRYDHGYEQNFNKYGQGTPPDYDLCQVDAPMVMFYSGRDWLSQPNDVKRLKSYLSNVWGFVYLNDYTHLDYVYATEARKDIYMKIISKINKFEMDKVINSVPKDFKI